MMEELEPKFHNLDEARKILWTIEEQTRVKHQLLKIYIESWMSILIKNQIKMGFKKELIYFDGFSGPGRYFKDKSKTSKCLGSPLLVANISRKILRSYPNARISIVCIDRHKDSVMALNYYLNRFNLKYKQFWKAYYGEFNESINSILDEFEKNKYANPPIFFFIDPFGYTGFPMTTLIRIMKYPLVELFINLDVYDIVRFCEDPEKEESIIELFGTNKFKEINECKNPEDKYVFVRNLYGQQILNLTEAKYILPFRVNTPKQLERPRYYLIHVSKNFAALKAMKDAMARASESEYRFEAIGISKQGNLFEDPDKTELRENIFSFIRENKKVGLDYDDIEKWAYINTNGIARTIKCELMKLESDALIEIIRKEGRRKNTVTKGAIIRYIEK